MGNSMVQVTGNDEQQLLNRLDWNLLQTFLVITESQSISDAALRLNRRQPTVSAALKRLEDALDRRLIERGGGRFQLTEAGEMLRRQAIDVHAQMLSLAGAMRETREEVIGRVIIAAASHVVCPLFDSVLRDFHEQYPRASVSIDVRSSRDAVAAVESGRASFALCLVRRRNPKLCYDHLYRERFGFYCGPHHPLFGRESLRTDDLRDLDRVSFTTDHLDGVLYPLTLLRAEAEFTGRVVGTSSALEEVRRMIIAGLGFGALPVHVAEEDVGRGRLWPLPPYRKRPVVDVYVVSDPRATRNRAEQALLRGLQQQIEHTPLKARSYG